ncbi:MAG TPA: hypothetical protein VFO71_10210 [Gemmatimonadales bacterium]|nr:hypothetical protein [Gemmatimonadales bacterium]
MISRSIRPHRSERSVRLPGDDILPGARSSTQAITIKRPRSEVWPWLVQMGAGRAGWYSYDRIDNGGEHSQERIVPQLQQIKVGDVFPATPGVTEGFLVLGYEPDRFLILAWPSPAGLPTVTWTFVLEEPAPGSTRLIVRARAAEGAKAPFGLPQWMARTVVPLGHVIMQRKQLIGIAQRAERGKCA